MSDPSYWDDELPHELKPKWDSWTNSLRDLSGLSVSRCYREPDFGSIYSTELHGFCDASEDGTGYVIYLRSKNAEDKINVAFVTANSKIVPKVAPTIPRLELCAALDLASSMVEVAEKLGIPDDDVTLHSDSMIVLGYLTSINKRFKKYVTRRVNSISKLYDSSRWRYINTKENPADVASRRQSLESLTSSCWLSGPAILFSSDVPHNPAPVVDLPDTVPDKIVLETRRTCNSVISDILVRCSSLIKAINVLTLIMRFVNNFRQFVINNSDPESIRTPEKELVLKKMVKHCQSESFPNIFEDDKYNGNLLPLSPFVDSDGLIRVGGRLKNSDLDYEHKFPLLLPKDHPFTTLLVSHYHQESKHQGRCITMSSIRNAGYFIHKGSSIIRKLIRNCVLCKKQRLPLGHQRMADLPPDRLEPVPPFTNTGMDVLGPYEITDGLCTRRTKSMKKIWAVIFTCLDSRAIHLEPLPFLDTTSMKNAMRRFFCVRGPCKLLRSDHGTNFVGVRNQDLLAALSTESHSFDCRWELNTPKASHRGGVWERPIQSVKRIMTSCISLLGSRALSRDEFVTFLQECACILNNSPLWEYSADPNDPVPLSPSMLLNLRSNNPVESADCDILAYGSKRWRRVQFLSDQFWSRWKVDYLQTLQKRGKWLNQSRNYTVGDVVLLKDAQAKRHQWPIAKVCSVKVSSDNLVRSVELTVPARSSSHPRKLWRPVSEICLLVPASN